MQEHVYQSPIQDVDDLKQRLISVWAEFKQSVIDKAIDQWRPRLRACVRASGQHFENWLIEITLVCWTVLFLQGHFFRANFQFKGKHSHRSISICQKQLLVLQGSVATLFRWSWKILSSFVANFSKTLRINFYQNLSGIVEVMIKKIGVFFMPHSVLVMSLS